MKISAASDGYRGLYAWPTQFPWWQALVTDTARAVRDLTPASRRTLKKRSPYSITAERRVSELIPVLGSQPASVVSHKPPGGRLPLLSARPAVTPATLNRTATNFGAWWTEARWVRTVCVRLSPDSVAAAIWTRALLRLSLPSRRTLHYIKTNGRSWVRRLQLLPFERAPATRRAIGNENAPIQLAQCWFPGLAISNSKR